MTTNEGSTMKIESLSVDVKLPAPEDHEFEAFVESVVNAVYERIKKRLQDDAEGAVAASSSI